ncbi:MAG: SCO family protein, partial [Actinomycetota bacterium]|nr:SCO family protein [Actinomycetota bacterium]
HPRLLTALIGAAALAFAAVAVAAILRASATDGARSASGSGPVPAGTVAQAPSPFEGSVLPAGVRAPDFNLKDQDGDRVRMRDLRGRPVIVTFVYTRCRESCPAQLQQIKGAFDELGRDVPALAIAVDPPHDTAASARHFLAEQGMAGRMDIAVGSRAELKPVWKGFAIQPQTENMEHQARFTLVDARGYQRVGFPLALATPERLAHDVRVLEGEQAR